MSNLRAKTCCFTGHRDIPESEIPGIKERAKRGIRLLYNNGVRFFGVGGALGFDTLMAQLLFRLRKDELKDIKVILVYPFEGFTSQWNDEQKRLYSRLLPYYDKVVSVARRGKQIFGGSFCVLYCLLCEKLRRNCLYAEICGEAGT